MSIYPRIDLTSSKARGYAARNKPYRTGIVTKVQTPYVRVQFQDYDGFVTYWLPVLSESSYSDKGFWLPDVGNQVVVMLDDRDEAAIVLGCVYSTSDPPPGNGSPSPLKLTADGAGSVSATPLTGNNFDDMFTEAAATCPALDSALPGVSGKNVLKGLAQSESSLNPNAVSEPARDGSRSWGLMQINQTAHPGYSPDLLQSSPELNIRIGTADLCGKLATYGNIQDATAHYKGWPGYTSSGSAQAQTDNALNLMKSFGTS